MKKKVILELKQSLELGLPPYPETEEVIIKRRPINNLLLTYQNKNINLIIVVKIATKTHHRLVIFWSSTTGHLTL